jgi:hypothetical protein
VADDNDDPMSLFLADLQAPAYQGRADPLVLEFRQDCHRRKGQGRDGPGFGDDRQVTEEDVADDLPILLSDEGGPDVPAIPEGVHETGLGVLAESDAVDVPDDGLPKHGFRGRTLPLPLPRATRDPLRLAADEDDYGIGEVNVTVPAMNSKAQAVHAQVILK